MHADALRAATPRQISQNRQLPEAPRVSRHPNHKLRARWRHRGARTLQTFVRTLVEADGVTPASSSHCPR
ncbi:hypothetical protein I552_2948 [Mycobacterium xenopi 3993]|nr:hypothetical protein I552_2948 [Mycobacterium xenopi 3993]